MSSEANGEISNEFFKKLNQQIVQKDNLIKLLQLQIKNLKSQIDSSEEPEDNGSQELKKELEEKTTEVNKLTKEIEEQKEQFQELDRQKEQQIEALNKMLEEHKSAAETQALSSADDSQVAHLEELVDKLRAELQAERESVQKLDEQVGALSQSDQKLQQLLDDYEQQSQELQEAKQQLDAFKSELEAASETSGDDNKIEELNAQLEEQSKQLQQANEMIAQLNQQLESQTSDDSVESELAQKLSEAEQENEKLAAELKRLGDESENQDTESLNLEIVKLNDEIKIKDEEISRLRVSLEASRDDSMSDPALREELEQLTRQTADQLLSIQKFESILEQAREEIHEKESKIIELENQLKNSGGDAIPVDGESDIITGFIDFFDGLDSILSKNPMPELQSLHKRLLDRLIIPNKISYMPSLSEQYDPQKHIATDYFRSDQFPEKHVVFEVEKGYVKGDQVVKKSKVWVVQNLFTCQSCNTEQSNADSRFCHLCGKRIIAPNGLPVDGLPEFEPNATTYERFADRELEKGNVQKAREYLEAGLEVDPNTVSLLVKHADVLVADSKFEEAMKLLSRASSLKQDEKIDNKMKSLEVKLNILRQAENLQLDPEEFEKLMTLIQK